MRLMAKNEHRSKFEMWWWIVCLASLAVSVCAKGEIKITNHPSGILWCGSAPFTLNFEYSSSDVPDGTLLDVVIMQNVLVLSNRPIATLGKVVAPVKQFTVTLPSPLTPELIGTGSATLSNEGLQQHVLFRVQRSDNGDVSSQCKGACTDPSVTVICCPADNTARCGCRGCSCANNDVCADAMVCDYSGKLGTCIVPPPSLGEPCTNKCQPGLVCQCPLNEGTSCVTGKTCQDSKCAKPLVGVPSRLGCPCSPAPEALCERGTDCFRSFCVVSNRIKIEDQDCTPATSNSNKDACMLHADGSNAAKPFSCNKDGKCTVCTAGDPLCICGAGNSCKSPSEVCEGGRCFLRSGCEGCPCASFDLSCAAGTICISNICTRPITPAPTTTAAPPPPTTATARQTASTAATASVSTLIPLMATSLLLAALTI